MKISSLASAAAAAVAVRSSWLPSRKTLSVKVVISMISKQGGPAVLLDCGVIPFRAKITYRQGIFHGVSEGKPGIGGLIRSLHILS